MEIMDIWNDNQTIHLTKCENVYDEDNINDSPYQKWMFTGHGGPCSMSNISKHGESRLDSYQAQEGLDKILGV